jgi:hypothetical protein
MKTSKFANALKAFMSRVRVDTSTYHYKSRRSGQTLPNSGSGTFAKRAYAMVCRRIHGRNTRASPDL